MGALRLPAKDPLLPVIKEMAAKACMRATFEAKRLIVEEDETIEVVDVTFERIRDCPGEGEQQRPFSKHLQQMILCIQRLDFVIEVVTTPPDAETPTGGNLGTRVIHVDGRRFADGVFGPGTPLWLLIHELAHFFHAPFAEGEGRTPEGAEPPAEPEIASENRVRRELGQDCYRYPDHGLEVYICRDPPNGLKAVEVGTDGKVKQEAPIAVGSDPNPGVPFTGGQRLAGPGTF